MFEAVVMVADERSLLEIAGRVRPALLVVDLSFARRDVARLVARLREIAPASKVIFLSVHAEPTVAQAVIAAGADGFLTKSAIASELIPAVEAMRRGERFVTSKS